MKDQLFKLYLAATVLLPFVLVYLVQRGRYKKRRVAVPKRHLPLLLVYAVYLCGVFYFTGAGTLYHALQYQLEWRPDLVNLVPFSQQVDVVGYLLNILLLVPLGFLLPLVWPRLNKLRYVLPAGFCFSLLVELSQLLNSRQTDVDDLLLNTLGAVLGWSLFRLCARLVRYRPEQTAYTGAEPLLYTGTMYLGYFLLYNEMGLARLLYNF